MFVKNEILKTTEISIELRQSIEDPDMNLFVWAVLMNRIEIAKIFWRIGDVIKRILFVLF
jgi:hypothetical protein